MRPSPTTTPCGRHNTCADRLAEHEAVHVSQRREEANASSHVANRLLLHVYGTSRFRDPVSTAMVSKLDKVDVRAPIEALLPVFDRGHVAIVTEGERFLGLITRIDLLNYLRRRVQ